MPTLEDVMEALRQADAAGNAEDARRLAEIANAMKQGAPQKAQTTDIHASGVMPYVNRAIADFASFLSEGVAGGISLIPGVDITGKPTEYIEKGFEAVGAHLPKRGRPPQTLGEHAGRGIGEVASFMIPGGVTTKLAARSSGLVGAIGLNIYRAMGKHPYMTMASELTSGVGMGTGRGIAEEATESPAIQTGAELVGGIMGGIIPSVMPTTLAYRYGGTFLRRLSVPFTKAGQRYRAGMHLKGMVSDSDKAATTIMDRTIGDLPPAVQSGEKKLAALYKNVAAMDPTTESETIERISESIIKLEGEMRKLGYGSPEALADLTRKRVAAIELSMDNRIMRAMDTAQKKLDDLPFARRYAEESRIVRDELDKVRQLYKLNEQKKWAKVPKNFEVGFDNTREKFRDILKDLSVAQQVDIPTPLHTNPIITNKKLTQTQLKEMQGLRSKLLEVSRQARKDNQWNKARIADEVADAILEDIDKASLKGIDTASSNLRAALAATKQYKTRFESGITGKILGYDRTGAPTIPPDLTLDVSIGRMGERGAIDISKIVVTPQARRATERYLARSYTDFALDKAGSIDPVKSSRWIKTNEAILDQFPELRTQLQDVANAQQLAVKTKAIMTARKEALRNPAVSISAKFLNSANLHATIETVLKSPDPAKMTSQLVRQARKDPTGLALEGLRAGFIDNLMENATRGPFNEIGEQTLSGRSLLHFIRTNESTLSKVFSISQITRIRRVGMELAKVETYNKLSVGKPDLEMRDMASSGLRLFARIAGARIGGRHGKESAGGSLQMAQIYSGKAKQFVTRLTRDRAEEMIKDAILSKDPQLLQGLLLPINKPGVADKNLRILGERMNLWLAGAGSRVMEDIMGEE